MRRPLPFLLLAILLVGTGLGIGLGLSEAPSGQSAAGRLPPTVGPTPPSISATTASLPSPPTVALPTSYLFDQISLVNGGLLLSGEVATTASSLTPTCVSATVDPQTLAIGSAIEASCDDPTVFGKTVGVVNGRSPHDNATISISSRNPETGQVAIGPVVMTYVFGSTSRPVVAYGGGWLWIYDSSVIQGSEGINTSNPGVAELLQVSTSNGQVVNSVSMPGLSKPLMAANDEGLWIGNSIFGGVSPGALYFVPSGTNTPEVMISTKTVVCWLTGNQNVLWLGISASVRSGCQGQMILRLNGTDPQPILNVPFEGPEGYQMNTVIGDESQGLWTVSPQGVVSIDPDTGAETVVATLSAANLSPGEAVLFDGSMYLLEPPFIQALGYSSLVRVSL